MSVRCTKAEKIARFFDKNAGWSDQRQFQMQKDAAALLRKYERLLCAYVYRLETAQDVREASDLISAAEESDD